jgi:hypothetical protein
LLELDSLYTDGVFYNNAGANVYSDSLWVGGSMVNQGSLYLHEITNDGVFENIGLMDFRRFTNLDEYYNTGSLVGSVDATNAGELYLATGSTFDLMHDFTNADSTDHNAVLVVEGSFDLGDSFYNADTVKGFEGTITLQNNSANSGWFKQTFWFCDESPLVTVPPFVDYNSGTIEAGVRYCTAENVNELYLEEDIIFYPNPVKSILNIKGANRVVLTDITGKVVLDKSLEKQSQINLSSFKSGVYFISLTSEEKMIVRRVIVE